MAKFTEEELSWLHTFLEGRLEVLEDEFHEEGADLEEIKAGITQLEKLVCDDPVISADEADWLLEFTQDTDDDEPGIAGLRAKLAAIIEGARK